MENIEYILSLTGAVIGLIVTILTVVVQFVKNTKAKKVIEDSIHIGNNLLPLIKEAENFVNLSGAEKQAYVMEKASQFAAENGMSFDATEISWRIEELIALTKHVNIESPKVDDDPEVATQEPAKTEESAKVL